MLLFVVTPPCNGPHGVQGVAGSDPGALMRRFHGRTKPATRVRTNSSSWSSVSRIPPWCGGSPPRATTCSPPGSRMTPTCAAGSGRTASHSPRPHGSSLRMGVLAVLGETALLRPSQPARVTKQPAVSRSPATPPFTLSVLDDQLPRPRRVRDLCPLGRRRRRRVAGARDRAAGHPAGKLRASRHSSAQQRCES